jgi:hypothetical protein
MSASDVDKKRIEDDSFDDSSYDDDLSLDLEMDQIIKRLDEVTSEIQPPDLSVSPKNPPIPKPVLTARPAQPVEDPPVKSEAKTILLTERLGPMSPVQEVIDLVDEIEPVLSPKRQAGSEKNGGFDDPLTALTVAEMTPEDLKDIISQAVETALRRFYAR